MFMRIQKDAEIECHVRPSFFSEIKKSVTDLTALHLNDFCRHGFGCFKAKKTRKVTPNFTLGNYINNKS